MRNSCRLLGASLLVLSLSSPLAPAQAQSFGDAFSSAGTWDGGEYLPSKPTPREPRYKLEPELNFDGWKKTVLPKRTTIFFPDETDPNEPQAPRVGARAVRPSTLKEPIKSAADPFFEESKTWSEQVALSIPGDAFSTDVSAPDTECTNFEVVFSSVTSSKTSKKSKNSVKLVGMMNGTIGPQLPKGKQTITALKPSKPPRAASPLRQTLHDIWKVESRFQPQGQLPTRQQMLTLNHLYLKASRQETHPMMQHYYQFMAKMAVEDMKSAWLLVDKAFKLDPENAELFKAFQEEFTYIHKDSDAELIGIFQDLKLYENNDLRRHYVAGLKALRANLREKAFLEFEEIFAKRPNDVKLFESIISEYGGHETYKQERVIWLSRYLKIAPDWPAFNSAWNEREGIEFEEYRSYLELEPFKDGSWRKDLLMPLKIYVSEEVKADTDLHAAIVDALDAWMFTAKGKMDYQFVEKKEDAKIYVHTGQQNLKKYEQFVSGTKFTSIPTMSLRPPKEADTLAQFEGNDIVAAEITFVEEGKYTYVYDKQEVALHEFGHALGLLRHSQNENDVMYPFKDSTKFKLSSQDKDRLNALYAKHPVNAKASERWLGMNAIGKTLSDPLDETPTNLYAMELIETSVRADTHMAESIDQNE